MTLSELPRASWIVALPQGVCGWRAKGRPTLQERTFLALLALQLVGCGGGGSSGSQPAQPKVPADIEQILTLKYLDPSGDQVRAPADAPPFVLSYPPADITRIEAGLRWPTLYMRVTWAAPIPSQPVAIPAQGGLPAMTVPGHGMSLVLDSDNDPKTGSNGAEMIGGVDIFFAVKTYYGSSIGAYANYDFANGDIHLNRGHLEGTMLEGGPGSPSVLVSFDLSTTGTFFRRGVTVPIGAWSESESFDGGGKLVFHHFTYDPVAAGSWIIPQ
jgi:hypothetical protein